MGKNLIVRETKYGRVVDFLEGEGKSIEEYRHLEESGEFKIEATDTHYSKKWDKWWESYE